MTRKLRPKFRAWTLTRDAVERALRYGWRRTFKHDDRPLKEEGERAEFALQTLEDAVMNELSETWHLD